MMCKESMSPGVFQTTRPLHYTVFAPVTDGNHHKDMTARLHGSKDAGLHQMMCGEINHSSRSLIDYNLMS